MNLVQNGVLEQYEALRAVGPKEVGRGGGWRDQEGHEEMQRQQYHKTSAVTLQESFTGPCRRAPAYQRPALPAAIQYIGECLKGNTEASGHILLPGYEVQGAGEDATVKAPAAVIVTASQVSGSIKG